MFKFIKLLCKKTIYLVCFSFSLFIFSYVLYLSMLWIEDNDNTRLVLNNIFNNVQVEEIKDDNAIIIDNSEGDSSDDEQHKKENLISVNFDDLLKQNDETVGWITVGGTNINYPIVQHTDNSYYLTHSYDKSYNEAGWIYLNANTSKNFDAKNNIIFGHSRLDKSMFGSLSNILTQEWFDNIDNHVIKISTPSENTIWQVFSVYTIKTEAYYLRTILDDTEYNDFLYTIKNRSIFNFNTSVNTEDKVLTLSTCYGSTAKTVLHAKLIKKEAR